jgi:hypothetical protein
MSSGEGGLFPLSKMTDSLLQTIIEYLAILIDLVKVGIGVLIALGCYMGLSRTFPKR